MTTEASVEDNRAGLRCSFCQKHQDDVWKMIAGPGVYICSECVEECAKILDEQRVADK